MGIYLLLKASVTTRMVVKAPDAFFARAVCLLGRHTHEKAFLKARQSGQSTKKEPSIGCRSSLFHMRVLDDKTRNIRWLHAFIDGILAVRP